MIRMLRRADHRLLAGYAALSLAGIACGVLTMVLTGSPAMRWIPGVAAWTVGALAALAIARSLPTRRIWTWIILIALALVAATLVGPGQQGVHRWLAAGPLVVNMAALTLPAAIVAMARLGADHRLVPIAATAIAAILTLQPDGSQAFAFAFAALVIMLTDRRVSALVCVLCVFGLAALSLLRPDPLQPVPEVEQIIQIALAAHPMLGWVAIVSLAAIPLALFVTRLGDTAARALALYIAAVIIAPMFGWFPVPIIGAGMSFPLGFWLGVALLAVENPPEAATSARES